MPLGDLNFMIGGSLLREQGLSLQGLFLGLNWQLISLLGEVDLASGWVTDTTTSRAAYAELDVGLVKGWRLSVKYNYWDQDTARGMGRDILECVTIGGELFPIPFVEVKPQVCFNTSTVRSGATVDVLLQLHAFL